MKNPEREPPEIQTLEFETWDGGRLCVNRAFGEILRQHGLTSFAAWHSPPGLQVAKDLRSERVTARFELATPRGKAAFYIKRHAPSPWKEYVKPLLRLSWPMLGARHEWDAILRFHAAGVPTMTPVALGEAGPYSFLVTAALDGCTKLSECITARAGAQTPAEPSARRNLISQVARVARRMHSAGLHHQDFYVGHLLATPDQSQVHIIDLGRARQRRRLGIRWIVKDLAQLDYSARLCSRTDRLRFLREYLDRPLSPADEPWLRRIRAKSHAIARHTRKNRL